MLQAVDLGEKRRSQGSGRTSAGGNPRTRKSAGVCEEIFEEWETFRVRMKDWASTVVPNKILHIHSEPRPVTQHSGFKYKLFCTSCAQCKKQLAQYRTKGEPAPDNGWNAIVEYNPETQMLTKEWAPLEMHGDFALTRIWSQLTSTAEEVLRDHLEKGRCTAVELLEIAVQHQDVIPDTEFIQGFMSNIGKNTAKARSLRGRTDGVKQTGGQ